MSGSTLVFYLLGTMTILSAILSVSSRQIFRSAIYLLFTLIGIAGLYFWMDYQFIAAVQIVVYVGGIAVLIIFSIFLTQQSEKSYRRYLENECSPGHWLHWPDWHWCFD
jgi:NADH-quinone oxidoreductase subunit J